jgi:16S rRNA (cytidine1402-2'-O)-methyltransferase
MAVGPKSPAGSVPSTKSGAPGLDFQTRECEEAAATQSKSGVAAPLAPGLYLVATPIGNLGDITLRALEVLRLADRIACEDTRQTQKLLNHFQIEKKTVSCHEHNERSRALELIQNIKAGKAIALVSDAGMPGISDPGHVLVSAAIAAGVPVIPIPGANAALSALVASGLSAAEFTFLGFLPEKAGARRTRLEALASAATDHPRTLILYEAPHRIEHTLADLEAVFGAGLRIVLARELTKIHEEFLRGTVAEVRGALARRGALRGEITLLVEAPARATSKPDSPTAIREKLSDRLARTQSESGIDEKQALKRVARELGRSKSEIYRELQRERGRR